MSDSRKSFDEWMAIPVAEGADPANWIGSYAEAVAWETWQARDAEIATLQRELDEAKADAAAEQAEAQRMLDSRDEEITEAKAESERLKDNYQTILDSHVAVQRELAEARAKADSNGNLAAEQERRWIACEQDRNRLAATLGAERLERAELREKLAHSQSCERSMREALIAADEAMVWELGGEPIPTLMIEARAKIKAAIAGQPKPQECGRCDNGEPCTNQYGICSRNGGWHHGELPVPIYGDSQPPFVTELAKVGDVVSAERFGNEPAKWFINGVEVSEPKRA